MTQFILRESKAVRPDDRTVFQGYMVAENAVLPNHRVSVRKQVISSLHSLIKDDMR